jgi:hypothetical protein
MALVMGFVGGFGLAFLTETLEDHVVGASDIEAGTGIKILAIIPHVKTRDRKEIATASLTHQFSEMAEAFAGLRSVLDSAAYREQPASDPGGQFASGGGQDDHLLQLGHRLRPEWPENLAGRL